jgi:hypothetical protein
MNFQQSFVSRIGVGNLSTYRVLIKTSLMNINIHKKENRINQEKQTSGVTTIIGTNTITNC